jgi:alpha-D-xyloside xylohydrolase
VAGGDIVLRSGSLEVSVRAEPFGIEFADLEGGATLRAAVPPEPGPYDPNVVGASVLHGFGFQTTESVGERRWRSGPGGSPLGPEHEEPPVSHGWFTLNRLVWALGAGEGATDARAETDDPAGRRPRLILRPVAEGVVAVRLLAGSASAAAGSPVASASGVEAVGISFEAEPGEAWLGFGERSDQVIRSQGVVEHYVGEGPYQQYEYPFLEGIVPPWGIRQRRDATYFPLPWVLSTRGIGVAVDNDETSYARLRPGGAEMWTLEAEAPWLGFHVFAGPTPLDALRRYTARAGPQPAPAAPWYFGPWYQTGHANHVPLEEERRQLEVLRAARAPISAAETHCRYLPLGAHLGHEEEERARVAHFHAAGLAVLSYLNPLVGTECAEVFEGAAAADGLQRRTDGLPYSFQAYAGGREPPSVSEAQFDFRSPAGVEQWKTVASELVAAGYDGWMEDFGEYTPLDARGGAGENRDGSLGTAGHNRYPTDYHAAAARIAANLQADAGRPLARFVRSGWSGTSPHVPIVWGGDPTTGWGWDGLASAVVEGLSAGASGLAMWGSDIGGFLSSVEHLTPELLCRWIEFGSLTPVMRTKSGGIDLADYRRPQIWDDEIIDTWVRWAAWHTQLNPYLQAAHQRYREAGRPMMCAFALADPGDAEGAGVEDQYWLGQDLVVAPVLEDGARSRPVYLPRDSAESAGGFVELWRATRYDPVTRSLELAAGSRLRLLQGGQRVDLDAPLGVIPVLLRAGAVLPLLSADVDTLSDWGRGDFVHAAEREATRRLLAFPRGTWTGGLGVDERITSSADPTGWRLVIESAAERLYELRADLSYLQGGAPAGLELIDGEASWSYDPTSGLLHADCRSRNVEFRFGGHP